MSLYQNFTEKLYHVIPGIYKKRYFKNLQDVSKENYSEKNIEPELIWVNGYLSQDAVLLDIGANVGSYLFQWEKKFSPKQIIAFEPNAQLNHRLKSIFPNLQIESFALSDKNETAIFKVPVIKGKAYHSRGTLLVDYKESEEEKQISQKVKVIKLDDWAVTNQLKKVDFIKIDVEGNEMKTLRGGEKTIRKLMPVLMVEMEQRHHAEPLLNLITEIENWNYKAHYLNRETFDLELLTEKIISGQSFEVTDKKRYINNIIFVPQTSPNPEL